MRKRLRVELQPARSVALFIGSLHGLALLPLVKVGSLALPLALLVALSGLWQWHRYCASGSASRVQALTYDGEGWWLQINGLPVMARLLPDSVVAPWCLVLRFHCLDDDGKPGRRVAVLVTPDAVQDTAYRRLRAFLRIQGQEALG